MTEIETRTNGNVRLDVETDNPRLMFRKLKHNLEGLGYDIADNSVNINKDAVGDIGIINAKILSVKTLWYEKESPDLTYSIFGAGMLVVGIIADLSILAILGLLIGIFCIGKKSKLNVEYNNYITIKGEGEVYRSGISESVDKQNTHKEHIVSELSVYIEYSSTYAKKYGKSSILSDIEKIKNELIPIDE